MSDHMKRLAAPRSWPLKRKVNIWVTKQSAGAHSIEDSMPAVTVLRDMVGVCDTAREAKRIIGNREMFVDGKAVKNPKAPVGFMDVITIPKMGLAYRMLLTDKGKLTLVAIGRNIVLDKNDYKCGDSLKVAFDGQKVLEHYPLQDGSVVFIKEGSQAGAVRTVKSLETVRGSAANLVLFTDGTQTVARNCFVIGAQTAAIKLPEASE